MSRVWAGTLHSCVHLCVVPGIKKRVESTRMPCFVSHALSHPHPECVKFCQVVSNQNWPAGTSTSKTEFESILYCNRGERENASAHSISLEDAKQDQYLSVSALRYPFRLRVSKMRESSQREGLTQQDFPPPQLGMTQVDGLRRPMALNAHLLTLRPRIARRRGDPLTS